jgi:uncharacterized protein YegP (UPF0339 family)
MTRFEIVRTAHAQWHWRIVSNGRILASSENYRRKVGCERAIQSHAGAPISHHRDWSEVRWYPNRETQLAEVRYIDDRLHPVKRPELKLAGA